MFFGSHQIDCVNIPDVYENVFMTMAVESVRPAISAVIDVSLLARSSETAKFAHTELLTHAHKKKQLQRSQRAYTHKILLRLKPIKNISVVN